MTHLLFKVEPFQMNLGWFDLKKASPAFKQGNIRLISGFVRLTPSLLHGGYTSYGAHFYIHLNVEFSEYFSFQVDDSVQVIPSIEFKVVKLETHDTIKPVFDLITREIWL